LGREATCVEQHEVSTAVERPVGSAAIFHSDNISTLKPDFALNDDWAFHCVERMWAFGYQGPQLAHLFNAIPPEISALMKRCLVALQTIFRLQPFKSKASASPEDIPIVTDELKHMQAVAEHWDQDEVHGFLQVSFNPDTNARQHVVMNSRYAHLHGYHKEEMIARFARRELELQRTEVDWLVLFLDNFQVSCALASPAPGRGPSPPPAVNTRPAAGPEHRRRAPARPPAPRPPRR
jgi:hypothetical protein